MREEELMRKSLPAPAVNSFTCSAETRYRNRSETKHQLTEELYIIIKFQ